MLISENVVSLSVPACWRPDAKQPLDNDLTNHECTGVSGEQTVSLHSALIFCSSAGKIIGSIGPTLDSLSINLSHTPKRKCLTCILTLKPERLLAFKSDTMYARAANLTGK